MGIITYGLKVGTKSADWGLVYLQSVVSATDGTLEQVLIFPPPVTATSVHVQPEQEEEDPQRM
jgi:hypothetical protein